MIYFIQAEDSRCIKIGFTVGSVRARFASLQTGNHERLKLLAAAPGDRATEMFLHRQFASLRVRHDGEWFRESPALLAEIRRIAGGRAPSEQIYNVWAKVERRDGCRHGLKGLRMRHKSGREFVCQGTYWGKGRMLWLVHEDRDKLARADIERESGRRLGWGTSGHIEAMQSYDELGIVCMADVPLRPAPGYYLASECCLLEDWPESCCRESVVARSG